MTSNYTIEEVWTEVKEPKAEYFGSDSLNQLTHQIIGACFDVHNELGKGFLEIVYKDALEYELKERDIYFEREKKYEIKYKEIILPHYYFADFVVMDKVIVEIKAQEGAIEEHVKQVINYLAASDCQVGLLINFAEKSLKYKRILLTK
jgi:GxxExxY protein